MKGKSIIVLLFILQISEKAHSQGRQFELERVDQRSYFGDHFHDAAVSPDQRTIITCGPGVIKLWTLDGRLIRSSLARTGCETVSYSTSGQYFILQNREMSELWSIPSFSVIREFPGRALFAPFANQILVVSKQSGFSLQDFNGNLILEFARGEKFIYAEISKSGRYILSTNAQNAASLWTIEGKKLGEIPGEGAAILSVKMDPEEKEIILSRSNRSIQRYSLDGALLNSVFTDASIEDLEFSRDGSFILGTSTQYSETLHNACLILRRDGSLLRTRNLIGRYLPFHCHFSGENLLVVHEGNVFLESPKQEVIARYHCPYFRPLNAFLTTTNDLRILFDGGKLVNLSSGTVASAENIASLGRLASSNSYLYCSRSNQAYLLQSSLAIAKEIPFDLCPFTYIGFNGKTIVTIGPESQIREWHIEKETGTVFSTSTDLSLVIEEEPRIVALSPGGEFYASENLGDIQVFSSKDRRKILQAHSSGRIVVAAFSPDDSFLVTGNDNGYVSILDMNGRSRKDLHVSDFQLSYISVSDEKQIAIGSRDGTIQILDRAGGVLKLLKGHTGAIQSLNYSNDFKFLISSSEDSTIRIWRLQKDTSFLELAFSQEGAYIFSGGFIESIPAALNKNIFFRRQNALSDESENGNFVRDLITKFLTEHDR